MIVGSYHELALARDTSDGFPRPLTFSMVFSFYSIHMRAVDFTLFKGVIGAIDVYEMDKFMKDYKVRKDLMSKTRK